MKINIDNNISDLNIFETVLNSICKTFSLVNFNDIYSQVKCYKQLLTAISNNISFLSVMSHTKILNNSALNHMYKPYNNYSPQDFNKSSTKRLYESVFKIIDFQECETSQFSQQNTNGSKITQFIKDEAFLNQLYKKMKSQNILDNCPILKVSIQQNNNFRSKSLSLNSKTYFDLDLADLIFSFSKLGNIYRLILQNDSKTAYILFTQFHSAYISVKLLNNIEVRGKMGKLTLNWASPTENSNILNELPLYMSSINWQLAYHFSNINSTEQLPQSVASQKQNKLTCRYDIQIQNQKQFQVARRIIGTKGCHMKKIIQQSLQSAKNNQNFIDSSNFNADNINQILKLRLRGRGSGYKEGPNQLQSEESLHLCISAKDDICYQIACEKVQKLILSVYTQYEDFTKNQGRKVSLKIKKVNIGGNTQNDSVFPNAEPHVFYSDSMIASNFYGSQFGINRLTPNKIQELLQLRNKARRQLNFIQADRIRNFLRSYGVCLIDEKGRRGKATQVTAWKYAM